MNGKQKLESLAEANEGLQTRLHVLEAIVQETADSSEERESVFTNLQTVRLRDAKLKYWARIIGGIFLALLLWVQNVITYQFILIAFQKGQLEKLALVLSIIVPATLAESAAIVHTAVKWIFKDTDYKRHS